MKCFNCKEEGRSNLLPNSDRTQKFWLTLATGHEASECKEKRVFDKSGVPDMSPDDAWNALQKADQDRDLDDFRLVCEI